MLIWLFLDFPILGILYWSPTVEDEEFLLLHCLPSSPLLVFSAIRNYNIYLFYLAFMYLSLVNPQTVFQLMSSLEMWAHQWFYHCSSSWDISLRQSFLNTPFCTGCFPDLPQKLFLEFSFTSVMPIPFALLRCFISVLGISIGVRWLMLVEHTCVSLVPRNLLREINTCKGK